eukprot:2154490-Amphidinium_carterae.1
MAAPWSSGTAQKGCQLMAHIMICAKLAWHPTGRRDIRVPARRHAMSDSVGALPMYNSDYCVNKSSRRN